MRECQVQTGAFNKGIEAYKFSAGLEITVAYLEEKAIRLRVSRHSGTISLGPGPKASKQHVNRTSMLVSMFALGFLT